MIYPETVTLIKESTMAVVKSNTGEKTVLLNEQEEILEKARFCKLSGIVDELHFSSATQKCTRTVPSNKG